MGGVLRHPPSVDLGDKTTKVTKAPLKPAWLREVWVTKRGDKREKKGGKGVTNEGQNVIETTKK